jgi:glycosyltransferase involved in cell wall biosynthesis
MKILCFTPLPYGDGSGWWGRDLGLTVRAFRQLGHDAQLVCYPTTHSKDPLDRPVQLITQSQSTSRDWWIQQSPDLILLGLWSQSKYKPIRTAALSSNALVIERCDGDGFRLPSCGHRQFWKNTISAQIDARPNWPSALAAIFGGGKAGLFEIFAQYFESRFAATLAMIPLFLSETPLSTQSLQSLASRIGSNPSRFQHVPHPIDENVFSYAGERKKNTVIAVGRWSSWQKDWPLTRKALEIFLDRNPDYEAVIFGSGLPKGSISERLFSRGICPQEEISKSLREAKILFFASRYEGSMLAGGEALLSGSSVIGPKTTPCSSYFASFFDGPTPPERTASTLAAALEAEARAWSLNRRDPHKISKNARHHMGSLMIAQKILTLASEINPLDLGKS